MLGNMLQGRDQQFVATKDSVTNAWRILDTWHESLRQLQPEDDIPDDSSAVTILTEGAFLALIREAARLGVLENASFGSDAELFEADLQIKDEEIKKLQSELMSLQEKMIKTPVRINQSESTYLKEKAMDNILKLAALEDMTHLSDKD